MKKRVTSLLLFCLFIFPSYALASDWVVIGRSSKLGLSNYEIYIDKDTVVKKGDHIIFWELRKLEDGTWIQKELIKIEAITSSPRQYKGTDYFAYTKNNIEINHFSNAPGFPIEFEAVVPQSTTDQEIDIALTYARKGKTDTQKPKLP